MSHHNPNVHLQTVSTFNNPKDDTIIQNKIQIYIEADIVAMYFCP